LDGTTHARLGMAIGKSTIAKTSVSSKAKHKASNLPPADLKNCSAACGYLVHPSFARPFTSSFVKETCIRYLGMGNPPFKVRLNDVSVYSVKLETSAACPKAPADVFPYSRARSKQLTSWALYRLPNAGGSGLTTPAQQQGWYGGYGW